MDIKGTPDRYPEIVNITEGRCGSLDPHNLISKVKESVQILLQNKIDYEFRTTVFPEFFTEEDAKQIAEWIKSRQAGEGAKRYVLQHPHIERTLNNKFKPQNLYSDSELLHLSKFLPNPIIR